jgi:hypothetical protein
MCCVKLYNGPRMCPAEGGKQGTPWGFAALTPRLCRSFVHLEVTRLWGLCVFVLCEVVTTAPTVAEEGKQGTPGAVMGELWELPFHNFV